MDVRYSKPQEVPNGDCRRDFEANNFMFVLFKHQDAFVVTLYVANATISRKRHYMSQKTPLYVANATICRNMQHYMSQTPPYVATQYFARKYKIDTICRKL